MPSPCPQKRLLPLLILQLCLAGGCSALTTTYSTPTAQTVCDDFESGASLCGGDFDKDQCLTDLSCNLALYRTEVIALIMSCGDRLDAGLCPAQKGYFCDEPEDQKKLAVLTLVPAANDFVRAFESKRTTCDMAGVKLRSTLYDQAAYLRDRVWLEARPCLDWPCGGVNDCLTGAILRVAPFCP